eukprot:scaffold19238_cov121-Isochrysis_galbana.AAC.3
MGAEVGLCLPPPPCCQAERARACGRCGDMLMVDALSLCWGGSAQRPWWRHQGKALGPPPREIKHNHMPGVRGWRLGSRLPGLRLVACGRPSEGSDVAAISSSRMPISRTRLTAASNCCSSGAWDGPAERDGGDGMERGGVLHQFCVGWTGMGGGRVRPGRRRGWRARRRHGRVRGRVRPQGSGAEPQAEGAALQRGRGGCRRTERGA